MNQLYNWRDLNVIICTNNLLYGLQVSNVIALIDASLRKLCN